MVSITILPILSYSFTDSLSLLALRNGDDSLKARFKGAAGLATGFGARLLSVAAWRCGFSNAKAPEVAAPPASSSAGNKVAVRYIIFRSQEKLLRKGLDKSHNEPRLTIKAASTIFISWRPDMVQSFSFPDLLQFHDSITDATLRCSHILGRMKKVTTRWAPQHCRSTRATGVP